MVRSKVAVLMGLLAWAAFGVMVIGPWFENEEEFWFSPRFDYAWSLTPVVFVLALVSFLLADGSDRAASIATRLSVFAGLALLLYWVIAWAWSIF